MKPVYTTLPVELCRYALINRKSNHLLVFIYLKHITNGHISNDTSLYQEWAIDLRLNKRTISNCINWLIKNKWITVNGKKQSLKIIGYAKLFKKLKFQSLSAVRYEPDNFLDFTDFCCAAVIIYYIQKKRFIDKKRRSGSKMEDSNMNRNSYPKGYSELPVSYLAKCLGVSNSTANNYKKRAEKAGFITIKRQFYTLINNNGEKITRNNYYVYQYQNKEIAGRYRQGRKYLKIVAPDLILIGFSTMRKHFKLKEKM